MLSVHKMSGENNNNPTGPELSCSCVLLGQWKEPTGLQWASVTEVPLEDALSC